VEQQVRLALLALQEIPVRREILAIPALMALVATLVAVAVAEAVEAVEAEHLVGQILVGMADLVVEEDGEAVYMAIMVAEAAVEVRVAILHLEVLVEAVAVAEMDLGVVEVQALVLEVLVNQVTRLHLVIQQLFQQLVYQEQMVVQVAQED
jgi:hypothetical protein